MLKKRIAALLIFVMTAASCFAFAACSSGGADSAEPDDSQQTEETTEQAEDTSQQSAEGKPYEIVLERSAEAFNNGDAEEIWEMNWISLAPSYEREEYISAYKTLERQYTVTIESIEVVEHLSGDEIEAFLETEDAEALKYDIETLEEKGILKIGDITEAYVVITKEHYEGISDYIDDDDLVQKQFICCVNGKWTIGEYLGEPREC